MQEAPIHQSHVYGQIKIVRTIFEKGHQRNIPVKIFQNLTSSFGEGDFLRISSCPFSVRSPHSPVPFFMDGPKSCEQGHQRNIPVKLFQNLTSSFGEGDFLRISSCPYIVQEAPIHQSHVFGRIKISQTIFEKDHQRNIPAKLFQNLTSGFKGRFLKNFFLSILCKKPQFTRAMFMDGSKLCEQFLKRVTQGAFL